MLRTAREKLVPALGTIFRDANQVNQARSFATDALVDYASDDPETLFELLMDAEPNQFATLFDEFEGYGDQAIAMLDKEINRVLKPSWNDTPIDPTWIKPKEKLTQEIEEARGLVAERFAFCQTLPLNRFRAVAEELSDSGYRPIRVRPYAHQRGVLTAAAWARDGREWRFSESDSTEAMLRNDESLRAEVSLPSMWPVFWL